VSTAGGLPPNLRKLSVAQRRERLAALPGVEAAALAATAGATPDLLDLADVMVESAIGLMPVPIGVAPGFLIDGESRDVPLAVEEPSVVAAATLAARLTRAGGGLRTWASEPVMTAQVFVERTGPDAVAAVERDRQGIAEAARVALASITARGGGLRGIEAAWLPATAVLRVQLDIDVRDAMGANILNTAAEAVRSRLEQATGGRVLMSVLTNAAEHRLAGAELSVRAADLGSEVFTGEEVADRIVRASAIAQEDPGRAVTHNKGIMNAISALALATGNDTRAVEAAAHAWAARTGACRGLSTYARSGDRLTGRLEMPLPMATAGGAVSVHPAARLALQLLGNPDGRGLARIAAAVGLAQNLAALRALVAEGIQRGHMRHHAWRLAWQAGARGGEIRLVAEQLAGESLYTSARAAQVLAALRAR
jgi:hydroxymethylglutaryl-CoA reductase